MLKNKFYSLCDFILCNFIKKKNGNKKYILKLDNSYLSHRIMDRFPRILKKKNFEIKTSFVSTEGAKAQASQSDAKYVIILKLVKNYF